MFLNSLRVNNGGFVAFETMKVIFEIEISTPNNIVFDFVSNPLNDYLWKIRNTKSHFLNNDHMAVGAILLQERKFLFKKIHTYYKITDFEKGIFFKLESLDSQFKIVQTILISNNKKGGCTVKIVVTEKIDEIIFKCFSFITKYLTKNEITRNYKNLKSYFEIQKNLIN